MSARRAIALAAFAIGCSETVPPPPPPPVDWASLNKPVVVDAGPPRATAKERLAGTAYAKAFATPGFAGLTSLLAEEAHMTFGGSSTLGRERVVAMHETLFGAFDDRSLALERIWMTDSSQALAWVLSGVQNRDWMGVPASHKRFAVKGLSLLWTKDDGSISDIHVYLDEALLRAQLGVGPADLQKLPPPAIPSGPPQVVEQADTPQEVANLGMLRGMIDALEDNKPAVYLASVTDDVEIHGLEHAAPARGKDAVRAYFDTMRRSIGQLDTLAQGGFGAGDWAILEYSISGVQLAPLDTVPFVRGGVIRVHLVDVAQLHNGKVQKLYRYDDPGEVAAH